MQTVWSVPAANHASYESSNDTYFQNWNFRFYKQIRETVFPSPSCNSSLYQEFSLEICDGCLYKTAKVYKYLDAVLAAVLHGPIIPPHSIRNKRVDSYMRKYLIYILKMCSILQHFKASY